MISKLVTNYSKETRLGITHNGTVADLDGLEHVEHQLGALAGEDQTVTKSSGAVDLVGEEDSLHGGGQVGDDTSHTEVEGLLGDTSQAEGLLDNFLYVDNAQLAYADPDTQSVEWKYVPPRTSYPP